MSGGAPTAPELEERVAPAPLAPASSRGRESPYIQRITDATSAPVQSSSHTTNQARGKRPVVASLSRSWDWAFGLHLVLRSTGCRHTRRHAGCVNPVCSSRLPLAPVEAPGSLPGLYAELHGDRSLDAATLPRALRNSDVGHQLRTASRNPPRTPSQTWTNDRHWGSTSSRTATSVATASSGVVRIENPKLAIGRSGWSGARPRTLAARGIAGIARAGCAVAAQYASASAAPWPRRAQHGATREGVLQRLSLPCSGVPASVHRTAAR